MYIDNLQSTLYILDGIQLFRKILVGQGITYKLHGNSICDALVVLNIIK